MSPPKLLLLDTHVFLWWRAEPRRLKATARDAIASANLVFVSAASAWEAAIKASLGRIELPASFGEGVTASGFERLPVSFAHAEAVSRLAPRHRDPFDRLLIAQAQIEGLTFVTHDRQVEGYAVEILWA